jgi:hypothetical protein
MRLVNIFVTLQNSTFQQVCSLRDACCGAVLLVSEGWDGVLSRYSSQVGLQMHNMWRAGASEGGASSFVHVSTITLFDSVLHCTMDYHSVHHLAPNTLFFRMRHKEGACVNDGP